jgi:cytidyltransferase-like protein
MIKLFIAFLILALEISAEITETHQKRIYVDVCADLMHAGHVEFFKKARELGDYLIVGVLSDEDIASYKRVPILTLKERVIEVEACRYVDEVFSAPPLILTQEWIKNNRIDLVVHGDDFDPDSILYWYKVPISMGIFKTVPYSTGISTTEIINRIKERYCDCPEKTK